SGFFRSDGVLTGSDVVVVSIDNLDRIAALQTNFRRNRINRGLALVLGSKEDLVSSGPTERTHPPVEVLREVLLLSRLPVIPHQAPAVALVSRTLLRAIGDVLPIRRIKRSLLRRLVAGSDVLAFDARGAPPSTTWSCTQIRLGADGFSF